MDRYVGLFVPLLTTPKDDPAQLPREQDLLNSPAFFPEAPARISKQSALVIEQQQLSDKETV